MSTKAEIQLESLKNSMANLRRRGREESSQLTAKAVMLVSAAGLGFIEGQEERTSQMSALRIGGFTPSQVVGVAAAVMEVMTDDKDTKNLASGVANAGLSIAAFQMGRDRGRTGAAT